VAIPGATGPDYAFEADFADNGASYTVIVSNVAGSVTSPAAVVTVNPLAPTVTLQPQAQAALTGTPVSFTTSAKGTPPIHYQWQRSVDQGATWTDIPGATATTYTFTATFADFNTRYRAAVTNPASTVHTLAAELQVGAELKLLSGALGGTGYFDGQGAVVRFG